MKKILLLMIVLQIDLSVSGQYLFVSSGISLSLMSINVSNSIETDRFNDMSAHFDILNILYEKILNDHLSMKSGFYLNQQKGHYTYREWFYTGMKNHIHEFSYSSVDIPLLLTYRSSKFNINAGPYLGVGISGKEMGVYNSSSYPSYLSRFEYGINISAGNVFGKWQMSYYILCGQKHAFEYQPEIGSFLLGFNLTRIIHFSHPVN